jgi:glycosyltransferase involved in cell wall biosynthesis
VNPLLGRLPADIYAVSEDLRRHMIAEGFPAVRVKVVHNGIDPGPRVTVAARLAARERLGLPRDAFVVGAVARLDPVKDLPTLVEAFAWLRGENASARLVIVGDGPERAALESEIRRHEVGKTTMLTGHREDVRTLVPAFDVFVNSSVHEGISLTILEAMAASLPTVAARVGGNPEVIDAQTGILVPVRSAGALGAALAVLASNPDRRDAMGAAARTRVETAFSIQRMVTTYAAAYRQPAGPGVPAHVWRHLILRRPFIRP